MISAPLVLLTLFVCALENGQPSDDCEGIEVRARSCPEALTWALGWIPPAHVVVHTRCTEQRVAAR